MASDIERGLAAGFASDLNKPLDLQRLQNAVDAALPGHCGQPGLKPAATCPPQPGASSRAAEGLIQLRDPA